MANRTFRIGQLASGTFMAYTHGANDAQKTMGVIALALFTNGSIDHFYIPWWVKVARRRSRSPLGTYVGGWRIMRTLGQRLYKMEPAAGFSAQVSAGVDDRAGDPARLPALDHTRDLRRACSARARRSGSRRSAGAIAGNIVVAWFLTIPAAALVAAAFYWPVEAIF